MTDTPTNEPKKVWIACRAKKGCTGNYAVIVFQQNNNLAPGLGQFNVASGGRMIRYRCCTCNGVFTITT